MKRLPFCVWMSLIKSDPSFTSLHLLCPYSHLFLGMCMSVQMCVGICVCAHACVFVFLHMCVTAYDPLISVLSRMALPDTLASNNH